MISAVDKTVILRFKIKPDFSTSYTDRAHRQWAQDEHVLLYDLNLRSSDQQRIFSGGNDPSSLTIVFVAFMPFVAIICPTSQYAFDGPYYHKGLSTVNTRCTKTERLIFWNIWIWSRRGRMICFHLDNASKRCHVSKKIQIAVVEDIENARWVNTGSLSTIWSGAHVVKDWSILITWKMP